MEKIDLIPIQAAMPARSEVSTKEDDLMEKLNQPELVGALPPWVQEEVERNAIMNDPRLVELLGNAVIKEIRKVEGGYIVVTDSMEMRVDVNYKPTGICGPAKFELDFHQPEPIMRILPIETPKV